MLPQSAACCEGAHVEYACSEQLFDKSGGMIDARREFERVDGHGRHAFHEFVLARIHHEQGERRMELGETSLLACVKQLGRLVIHKKRIGFVDDNTMCFVILCVCVCVCQIVEQKHAMHAYQEQ